MLDITFTHNKRNKTFYYCEDVNEAKERFQWRYGYWPNDDSIVSIIDSKRRLGEGDSDHD